MIWIDDPLVSRRICATSTEMNQMLTNALGFPSLVEDGNVQQRYEEYESTNQSLVKLLTALKNGTDENRTFLTQLHSLEKELLSKKIDELRTKNPNALNYGAAVKNYDQYMLIEYVDDMDNDQTQRFETYNQTIDEALELTAAADSIDLNESREILNECSTTSMAYVEELVENRKQYWQNEENNRLVAMRANLSEYFVDGAGVPAEDEAICQETIDAVRHRLGTTVHAEQNAQKINMEKQKIQTDLIVIVNSMDALVQSLDVVAQSILDAKIDG